MADPLPDFTRPVVLAPEVIADYRRDGYALLRQVCTPEELAPLRPVIREVWAANKLDDRPISQRDTYGRAFTQGLNLGLRHHAIFRFAYGRRFAKLAADLMGVPRVRMFLDEAFFKEPGSGPTPWHQDQPVWPFDAERGITLWIPLMDVTHEMGTLTFAVGSHHHKAHTSADISDESESILSRLVAERAYPQHAVTAMTLGDLSAHDGWMVHRAGANHTDTVREAYAMHYFADGARVLPLDNPTHARILAHYAPGLRPGDPAVSERWRLVYPEADPLLTTL